MVSCNTSLMLRVGAACCRWEPIIFCPGKAVCSPAHTRPSMSSFARVAGALLLPRHHAHPLPHPIIGMIDHLLARLDTGDELGTQARALADRHAAFDRFALRHHEDGPALAIAEQGAGEIG